MLHITLYLCENATHNTTYVKMLHIALYLCENATHNTFYFFSDAFGGRKPLSFAGFYPPPAVVPEDASHKERGEMDGPAEGISSVGG